MNVAALVGVLIGIVVGVNLLVPAVNTAADKVAEDPDTPSSIASLLGILPIVFIVVLILGAIAWMGTSRDGGMGLPRLHMPKLPALHARGLPVPIGVTPLPRMRHTPLPSTPSRSALNGVPRGSLPRVYRGALA